MLLTRQIEADPPEITTQSATRHMSRAEGQDSYVYKTQSATPNTVLLDPRLHNTDTAQYVC